jgi:NAD(P)-dependent dehydrogenase (short-subunit alcohol dehydrogenase family)
MSRVAVIGPGRVGTLLALALRRAGHRLVAVGGGREASRAAIVEAVPGARSQARPADAAADAELVVVCVPDDALEEVVTELAVAHAVGEGQHVVHVAGSQGLAPLRRAALAGAGVAACHPAMTIPTGARDPDVLVGTAWRSPPSPATGSGPRSWSPTSAATRTTCPTRRACCTTPVWSWEPTPSARWCPWPAGCCSGRGSAIRPPSSPR